ncbi:MAG: STAS domain-containing protein [Pseudomonadota bacterium]
MSDDNSKLDLPERMDSSVAKDLYSTIDSFKGTDVTLNGQNVRDIGGLCLQVLIAAKEEWGREDKAFQIHDASEEFQSFLTSVGRGDLITAEATCP